MGIIRNEIMFDNISEITCDSCGKKINKSIIGEFDDFMEIRGNVKGKILEAVVCVPCMNTKIAPLVNITKKDNPIGYC